ncbi:CHAT domain-containing protein [Dactylosporangium sp. NBC_01737]|uniref:CHAT domain-containing protein n=1 Tax=Dactylosporangium sp. NBC_01737 TaxID=2975959 RepID=UPI002E129B26|nr:CHAT domain-containing protein [Dactylosporangium sp. NBC_01737]
MELILKAIDTDGRYAWRWLLTDAAGNTIDDHTVRLDPAARETAAMVDLYHFVRRAGGAESVVLDEVGGWLGREVLGVGIGRAIVAARPAVVWVEAAAPVDPGPLELAHVDGVPLAAYDDIALIFRTGGVAQEKRPIGESLRMLAVFSQPTATTALALRHERFALSRFVGGLPANLRKAIDLDVLQYGVTRKQLRDRMWKRQGPDILHISAHGTAGGLVLESETGTPDLVGTDELVNLLRPAKHQLKLVVLSACESAAGLPEAPTWALLDPTAAGRDFAGLDDLDVGPVRWAGTGLAQVVARELDCAVLAMRFPVSDEYAIALASEVYDGLFNLELSVAAAVARAVPEAAGAAPTPERPAISIAVPTLHGAAAAGLPLVPPAAEPRLDLAQARMAGFPPEPEHFVGRTAVLTSAARALSAGSPFTTVLIDGQAGVGKTACALELAYGRRDTFGACAYWSAPDDFAVALGSLAHSLERQLEGSGFTMSEAVGSGLYAYLPRLTELLTRQGLLIVLDNLERLLTAEGRWRDPRWADLIAAVTSHRGGSRVILASQVPPVDLDRPDVCRHRLGGLSPIESLQLMRELPGLKVLLPARDAADRSGWADRDGDRARQILAGTRGVPELIMRAETELAAKASSSQWEPPQTMSWPAHPHPAPPPGPPPPVPPRPAAAPPPQPAPTPTWPAPPISVPPYQAGPVQLPPAPQYQAGPVHMPAAPQSPAGPPAAGLISDVVAARIAGVAGMHVAPPAPNRLDRTIRNLERTIRNAAGISDREQTLAVGRLPVGAALLLTDAAMYWLDKDRGSVVIAVPYRAFPGRVFRAVASAAGVPPTHVDLGDGIPRSAGGAAADLMALLTALQAVLLTDA